MFNIRSRSSKSVAGSVLLLALAGSIVSAAPITISIFPSAGPKTASPSFPAYRDNALTSLETGLGTSIGDPATSPTAYRVVKQFRPGNVISSSGAGGAFHSWEGVAGPGGAFSGEFGEQLFFGLRILGQGTKFNISNISFDANSTDPQNRFAFHESNLFGSSGYNASRIGIIYGPIPQIISSGPATQMVDEFDYVGVGISWDATLEPGTNQQKLDAARRKLSRAVPFNITGKYSLMTTGGALITASQSVSAVPEPGTVTLGAVGLALWVVIGRLRRIKP